MNEMKKEGFFKAAFLMLVVMALAVCVVSATMAKYYSKGTASGLKVTVARWEIDVANSPISTNIDLSEISWEVINKEFLGNLTENRIAPGTWGYAAIEIVNNGDVDAMVTISGWDNFLPTDVGTGGLSFAVYVTTSGEPDSFESAETGDIALDTIENIGVELEKSGGCITIYACYEWEIEADDSNDTSLGEAEDEDDRTFSFGELTINAWQAQQEDDKE